MFTYTEERIQKGQEPRTENFDGFEKLRKQLRNGVVVRLVEPPRRLGQCTDVQKLMEALASCKR